MERDSCSRGGSTSGGACCKAERIVGVIVSSTMALRESGGFFKLSSNVMTGSFASVMRSHVSILRDHTR
jgi:hypothetical protein